MNRYAARTEVSSDKTRVEIERTLVRYGATGFGYMWQATTAVIIFEVAHRRVMMRLPLPARDDPQFTHTPGRGQRRSAEVAEAAYEQAVRQRWRGLLLIIKAKLEAVAGGITTIEREFLPDVVLPNQQTVGEWLQPQIEAAYRHGDMPALLPGATPANPTEGAPT